MLINPFIAIMPAASQKTYWGKTINIPRTTKAAVKKSIMPIMSTKLRNDFKTRKIASGSHIDIGISTLKERQIKIKEANKSKKPSNLTNIIILIGVPGLEPGLRAPKARILPLYDTPSIPILIEKSRKINIIRL